ncbi:hypothetical protein [Porphyromonas macacae]|uniref:Uncharacterized protein n=1 Tax=Porphyromonas macacae TaxID=28115 RepID=A0A379DH64_9PORP|nr:hypothetical protein [Porphyromonas macacae]SUB77294.1 Uncharacterised protein [Porphyromonas macacae]
MSELLLIISIVAVIKLLIEEAQRASIGVRIVHAVLFVLYIVWIHPICLNISKLSVDAWLASAESLQNITLAVIADLMLCLLLATANEVSKPDRRYIKYYGPGRAVAAVLHRAAPLLPPLLAWPALFYLRIELLFDLTGVSFIGVTATMAVCVAAIVVFAPQICNSLHFKAEMRKEMSILCSLFTLAAVVGAGVLTLENHVYGSPAIDPDTGILLAAIAAGAGGGYLIFNLKHRHSNKNNV